MNDRGEKIVNLARELLHNDFSVEAPAATQPTRNPIPAFKTLCFAALIAAFGSTAVTQVFFEDRRPLNRYERTELAALLFYATRVKPIDEAALRIELQDKLALTSLDDMSVHDFHIAKMYLQAKIR